MKYRNILSALIIIQLSACGGSGSTANGSTSSAQSISSSSAPTIASALLDAQVTGGAPKLDRTDSILGTDTDTNGVRDDLDAYISSLSDTPAQKSSLQQLAKALQFSLTVDTTDSATVVVAANKIFAASSCIQYAYESPALASSKNRGIEKYLINTKARFAAYSKLNMAASGGSYVLPEGDGCESK